MSEEVIRDYLRWLAPQIAPNKGYDYIEFLSLMYDKEFVWIVANDDNRIQDAIDLRVEWFHHVEMPSYVGTDILGPVSVLEVIIGVSRRLAFHTSDPPQQWAWQLIKNLELNKMRGHLGHRRAEKVDDTLERLIWRTYSPDGQGGLFPLAWPSHDQREIEIWYQMNAYLMEHEDPHEEVSMY